MENYLLKSIKILINNDYIPVGTFVRIKYPQGDFKGVFKLPETSLYGNKVYIVKNNIAKERTGFS